MRALGIVLLIVGVIVCIIALSMDTTVTTEPESFGGVDIPSQTVNNIGLMDDRRNTLLVGGLGVLAGVVLIAVGSLRRSPVVAGTESGITFTADSETKRCPYCAEDIKAQAVVCRYCGRDVPAMEGAVEVEPLPEVPEAMSTAYEAWQKTLSEDDYQDFRRACAAAAAHLRPGTTAAQLEAAFPGIPIDFDELVALVPTDEDPQAQTRARDQLADTVAIASSSDEVARSHSGLESLPAEADDAQPAPRRRVGVLIVSAVITVALAALLIAFLAGAPIPLLSHLRDTPANAAVKAGIHSIQAGVESYKAQTGAYPYGELVSWKNLAAYVTAWPENPYTHLPMTSGTHSGEFYYTLDGANDVFSLTGYGDGDKAIITVP